MAPKYVISKALEGEHELERHGNYIGMNFFNVSTRSSELLTDGILSALEQAGYRVVKGDDLAELRDWLDNDVPDYEDRATSAGFDAAWTVFSEKIDAMRNARGE